MVDVGLVLFSPTHTAFVEGHAIDSHGLAGDRHVDIPVGIADAQICGAVVERNQLLIRFPRLWEMPRLPPADVTITSPASNATLPSPRAIRTFRRYGEISAALEWRMFSSLRLYMPGPSRCPVRKPNLMTFYCVF